MNINIFKIFILLSFSILSSYTANSQGCSDAGACTMGLFNPEGDSHENMADNQIKIGMNYGKADYSISVIGNYFEYNRRFSENFGMDFKVSSISQSGNGISTFGLSDIFINANYSIIDKFNLSLGAKIPLSLSNNRQDDIPLPLDYQSSLGTYDIIFGLSYQIEKFQIAAAVQYPLTENENQFKSSDYPTSSKLSEFQSTNNYKRGGDVIFRVSYPVVITEGLLFTPSILPIYHLANDKYSIDSINELEIEGSKGLTFNGNVYLDYELGSNQALQSSFAMPFITRENRPDGLTRALVANLEYKHKFWKLNL